MTAGVLIGARGGFVGAAESRRVPPAFDARVLVSTEERLAFRPSSVLQVWRLNRPAFHCHGPGIESA